MSPGLHDGALAPLPGPDPAPRPGRRPGEHLRPVPRPGRRRSPAVPALVATGIVITALFGLAVMHALLIGGQLRLDGMQREVASEAEEIRRLRLRVAELEAPDRVLGAARERLGMVQPAEVGYLPPAGVETGSDDRVRVAPAEVPAPEPTDVEAPTDGAADDAADGVADDAEVVADAPVAGGGDE